MEQNPRFSAAEWDFLVFPVSFALVFLSFYVEPPLSFVFVTVNGVGLALLLTRIRRADRWNARHKFSERIPAGSKFNLVFVYILAGCLIQQVVWQLWLFFNRS